MTNIILTILAILGIHTQPATVTNYIDDVTIGLITEDGSTWVCEVDNINEYKINEDVTITFNAYNNDNIYDDEIINIEKA